MVYFVQGEKSGLVKIGKSDNLKQRLRDLQRPSHEKLVVLATIPNADDDGLYHTQFRNCWYQGEWFNPSPELLAFIEALPKSEDCGVALYTPIRNCNVHPQSYGPFPQPSLISPLIDDAVLAEYVNTLRADATDTALETRIANSASTEEVHGWLAAAMRLADEKQRGLNALD